MNRTKELKHNSMQLYVNVTDDGKQSPILGIDSYVKKLGELTLTTPI